MIVYKLTFSSGKKYIGQTRRTLSHRLSAHRSRQKANHKAPIYEEWRSCGEPVAQILETCVSIDALYEAEQKWIKLEESRWPDGLNIAEGGLKSASSHTEGAKRISEGRTGVTYSYETLKKFSASSKKLWQQDSYRQKVAKGVAESFTDERRSFLSQSAKRIWDEKHEAGWKMPQATKDKISKRVVTEEQRRKMSESAKKRVRGPRRQETKDKIAAKTKAFWQNASDEQIKARSAQISLGFKKPKSKKELP